MPRIVTVAGTHSGCGKTTVALGLMAALRRMGLVVQPYKSGPDFIDPGHHTHITGRTSHNLDGWMMGRSACIELAHRGMFLHDATTCPATSASLRQKQADIGVLEGVMGLFDGASGSDETGSTAQLAKWLHAPVILVVDARSMARSAAAMVSGYVGFDPALQFAGVVFNRVGSSNHRSIIAEAMQAACPQIPVLGFLPRNEELTLPSRHLGLTTTEEAPISTKLQDALADWVENAIDLPALLQRLDTPCAADQHNNQQTKAAEQPESHIRPHKPAASAEKAVFGTCTGDDSVKGLQSTTAAADAFSSVPDAALKQTPYSTTALKHHAQPVRLGIARDQAFCFTYAENLRLLHTAGAELVFFSPLHDAALPPDLHGIYLGGGYPEMHSAVLNRNSRMREDIHAFSASGGVIYAECGGFMYLMQQIYDTTGSANAMCGCFPLSCSMGKRFRALGYRQVETTAPSIIGPAGTTVRGHEFHYSHLCEVPEPSVQNIQTIYRLSDRKGTLLTSRIAPSGSDQAPSAPEASSLAAVPEGFVTGNTLGSYVHLHFSSNPDVAHSLLAACRISGITTG